MNTDMSRFYSWIANQLLMEMLLLKSPRLSTWNKRTLDVHMLLFVWIWMLLLQWYILLDLLYSPAVGELFWAEHRTSWHNFLKTAASASRPRRNIVLSSTGKMQTTYSFEQREYRGKKARGKKTSLCMALTLTVPLLDSYRHTFLHALPSCCFLLQAAYAAGQACPDSRSSSSWALSTDHCMVRPWVFFFWEIGEAMSAWQHAE